MTLIKWTNRDGVLIHSTVYTTSIRACIEDIKRHGGTIVEVVE